MRLQQAIDEARINLRSDSYQMSIGELATLYEADELRVQPAFQRLLRWSHSQRVAFIESVLLQFPLPSIFVAARSDGTWDLIDGLQRISALFEFMGILRDPEGARVPPLRLSATERFEGLEGMLYQQFAVDALVLPEELQIDFKRQRMDVKIILRESSEDMLYELFVRLNTGGAPLALQDVRNAVISHIDSAFWRWMENLRTNEHFVRTLSLSDNDRHLSYDAELFLAFILAVNDSEHELEAMGDFDEALTSLVKRRDSRIYEYDRIALEELFATVFDALDELFGAQAFQHPESRAAIGLHRFTFAAIVALMGTISRRNELYRVRELFERVWRELRHFESFAEAVRWGREMATR